jgi:hypothetical protein
MKSISFVNLIQMWQYTKQFFTISGLTLAILVLIFEDSNAQSVGISGVTITPNSNSLLEIQSTAATPKGFLIPRMSRADRVAFTGLNNNASNSSERGMLVYQYETQSGDAAGFWYWTGTAWTRMLDASLSVSLQASYAGGNTITTSGGNALAISGSEKFSMTRSAAEEVARFQRSESSGAPAAVIVKGGRSGTDDRFGAYQLANADAAGTGEYIAAEISGWRAGTNSGNMRFYTSENSVLGERMRLTTLGLGVLGGLPTATNAIVVNGKVKSTGINETSDGRLKKNITPISSALSKILSLEGVTYDWRKDEFPERNFLAGKQYGLIAQELEKIIPELVDTDEEGWKSIEYSHLVPVLIEAIKEQQAIIANQQLELTSLKSMKEQVDMLNASVELLNEHIRTSQK